MTSFLTTQLHCGSVLGWGTLLYGEVTLIAAFINGSMRRLPHCVAGGAFATIQSLVMTMGLLPIGRALQDLHTVDEDEGEAVAICLIEYIFAETNALYRQHCLAREAITATATLLTTNIFDAVASASLQPETAIDAHRFDAESSPVAEVNDRHAARCLPHRSIDKPEVWPDRTAGNGSPTHRSKADSHAPERGRMSVVKRRRKPEFNVTVKPNLVTIPQVITLPEVLEEESTDAKAWRIKCMKELNGEGGKPMSRLGGMSKWASFTRQSSVVEPRVSLEVEVIDCAPPLLRQEVSGAASANAVKMKSSLNTFSAISTPSVRQGSAASTSSRAKDMLLTGSKRPSLVGSQSAPVLATLEPRKGSALQLNDALSRKRTALGSPNSYLQHGTSSASSVDVNPWRLLDSDEDLPSPFAPDMMVASAAGIPTSIALSAGVGFTYGESTAKGPERRENNHTMSRKRFELHQRLATDHLMQESMLLQAPVSPTPGSTTNYSSGSVSPLSTHSQHPHKQSPRPYAVVPPEPVPTPSLSPIAKDALVIPRNHLVQSASTPQLRVRNSSALKRTETASNASLPVVTSDELEALRRVRPSTALGAVVVTTPRKLGSKSTRNDGARPKTSSGSAATTKYLREFPKPHAGTIQLNAKKAGAVLDPATDVDSARQRMAWIS